MNKLTLFTLSLVILGFLFSFNFTKAQVTDPALIEQLSARVVLLQQQIRALELARANTAPKVFMITQPLKYGASGDQVTLLQAILAADTDIYPEGEITGYFGSLTEKAVKQFQVSKGLEPVGFVGPKTREKLNATGFYSVSNPLTTKKPPLVRLPANPGYIHTIATSTATTTPPDDDTSTSTPSTGHVTVCHIPPGNPDNAHTITIDSPAWPAHRAHGDTLGSC